MKEIISANRVERWFRRGSEFKWYSEPDGDATVGES
jgi:hypothetical protein